MQFHIKKNQSKTTLMERDLFCEEESYASDTDLIVKIIYIFVCGYD